METKSPYVAGRLEAGLTILITSLVLGAIGFGLFLFAASREGVAVYRWREAALILAAIGLTAFMWSLSVALPTRRILRWLGYVALACCGVAIVMFALHYPLQFNVPDATDPGQKDFMALDVGLYGIGLAVLLAAAVVSVVSHYIRFADPVAAPEAPARKYEVPDWVVEKDLNEALERSKMSWGLGDGPEAADVPLPALSPSATVAGQGGRRVELEGGILEHASQRLMETRPALRSAMEAPSEWADEPADALVALQRAKRADPRAYRPRTGFWSSLFGRRSGPVAKNGAVTTPTPLAPRPNAEDLPTVQETVIPHRYNVKEIVVRDEATPRPVKRGGTATNSHKSAGDDAASNGAGGAGNGAGKAKSTKPRKSAKRAAKGATKSKTAANAAPAPGAEAADATSQDGAASSGRSASTKGGAQEASKRGKTKKTRGR